MTCKHFSSLGLVSTQRLERVNLAGEEQKIINNDGNTIMKRTFVALTFVAFIALTGCEATPTHSKNEIVTVETISDNATNESQVMIVEYTDGKRELVIHQTVRADNQNAKKVKLATQNQRVRGILVTKLCHEMENGAPDMIAGAGYTVKDVPTLRVHIETDEENDILNMTCTL